MPLHDHAFSRHLQRHSRGPRARAVLWRLHTHNRPSASHTHSFYEMHELEDWPQIQAVRNQVTRECGAKVGCACMTVEGVPRSQHAWQQAQTTHNGTHTHTHNCSTATRKLHLTPHRRCARRATWPSSLATASHSTQVSVLIGLSASYYLPIMPATTLARPSCCCLPSCRSPVTHTQPVAASCESHRTHTSHTASHTYFTHKLHTNHTHCRRVLQDRI